ncbi:M61 family metallopeptidase [uncultured Sphingomonas sp.]|uniref:M61 family metallopeptidase n=1 Tax=uncultured Sphingomonas sp. TaxID=158754 RepID=UPI0035C97FC2
MRARAWMLAGAVLAGASGARAQDPGSGGPIQYDVRFPNAVHHEARIAVTYRDLRAGPVRFQMARSSPGRYALHEFAKNVYSVSAVDGAGRPLAVTRADPYGWSVAGHDGTATVTYTLYGDRADGTYAQIDATHAHLNMPATFLWAVGYDERPIRVRFHAPDPKWKIATQLPDGREPNSFWAPGLQYLMDSPTELSDFRVREWTVGEGAGRQTIRLAVHHGGSDVDLDRFAAKARRVIDRQLAVFGGPPRFDHGRYTVIADYLPWVTGDGMEHRNSTIVTDARSLAEADFDQIQTLSHEFFHSWNVERIRPAELEPFDFTRANPTPSLWLAEGFTSYYGPLAVRRAGEQPVDAYLAALGSGLNAVLNAPARAYGGPREMSLRAPFVDAARSIDPVNPHIFVSYYSYGAVVALALDLSIRERFPGRSLDDFMRRLWRTYGETETPYTPDDLRRALAEATGDRAFADAFFARSIDGSALPDFAPLLAKAGLLLRPTRPGRAWLGASRVTGGAGGVTLAEPPMPGSPLHAAGVERDDVVASLGGTAIADAGGWSAALERLRPGARVELVFRQRGRERRATLVPVADPTVEVVRMETADVPVTAAQRAFRAAWLGGS